MPRAHSSLLKGAELYRISSKILSSLLLHRLNFIRSCIKLILSTACHINRHARLVTTRRVRYSHFPQLTAPHRLAIRWAVFRDHKQDQILIWNVNRSEGWISCPGVLVRSSGLKFSVPKVWTRQKSKLIEFNVFLSCSKVSRRLRNGILLIIKFFINITFFNF